MCVCVCDTLLLYNPKIYSHLALPYITLYLRTLREKYIKMYAEFTSQLHMHEKTIRTLSKVTYPFLYCHHQNYKEV